MIRLLILILIVPFSLLAQKKQTFSVHKGKVALKGSFLPNEKVDFHSNVLLKIAPNPKTERPISKKEGAADNEDGTGIVVPSGINKPEVYEAFSGNVFDFRVPNDNSLAVSKGTKVVSVINASVSSFDGLGNRIDAYTLNDLASPLGLKEIKYDPRVIYDPDADRFILVYLNGFADSTSRVIIAFSKTNDPVDGWNLYTLPGNFLNDHHKSDFPAISITTEHLYITLNRFDVSGGTSEFDEGVIWKVDKASGYQAKTLSYQYFDDIRFGGKSFFSIYPVKPGRSVFGPEMYFVANRGTEAQNDSIFLLKIFTALSGNDTLTVKPLISLIPYRFPPLADQPGSKFLETNDARITGAFLHQDCLQFVATSEVSTTGKSGIFHGLIWNVDSENPYMDVNLVNLEKLYCGFPNIASTASKDYPHASMIIFNYSADTISPGFGGLFYDTEAPYSLMVDLKKGKSPVTIQSGAINRWGDYTGIQPHYAKEGVVWAAGSYGENSTHNTWITRIHMPSILGIDRLTSPPVVKAYPNPFSEMVKVDFTVKKLQRVNISLLDMSGRRLQVFLDGNVEAGIHQFTFSTAPLPGGVYFLQITGAGGELLNTKKLIKP